MVQKLFVSIMLVLMVSVGASFACNDWECRDYEYVNGMGKFKIGAEGAAGAVDMDSEVLKKGGAFGISGAGGLANADASGYIVNGMTEGEVGVVGGGLTVTEAFSGNYDFDEGNGNGKYVGSASESYAITGGRLFIKVDPEKRGFGIARGDMSGIAGQGTLNASYMVTGNKFENDGFTGGVAAQGSVGAFEGEAFVISGGDYYRPNGTLWEKQSGKNAGKVYVKPFKWHPKKPSEWEFVGYNCVLIDSKAKAELEAEIEMMGGSESLSWKEIHIDTENGIRTEAMGTNVSAWTEVNTSASKTLKDKGRGYAQGCVTGSYTAIGGTGAYTQMSNDNANLNSHAVGVYYGHGTLNTNFAGSANGYTNGSITTVEGMKGSIVRSGAGMEVSATFSGGSKMPK
jgi:hypothetical protein